MPVCLFPVFLSQQFLPLLPLARKISTESFFESKTEESKSSEMSCQFSASANGQMEQLSLQAVMRGFEDMFALDMAGPVLHSGMRVHMQAKQNTTTRSTVVRQGRKITTAVGFGDFSWSEDSD